MKVLLMFQDQDFKSNKKFSSNANLLIQDLELNTIFSAMSRNDEFLNNIVKQVILTQTVSLKTIFYRQEIVKDCLEYPDVIKEMYQIPIEALKTKQKQWMGIYSHHPTGILSESLQLLNMFLSLLKRLRKISDKNCSNFKSAGFQRFFTMIQQEMDDNYITTVEKILKEIRFNKGILISTELGKGNEGTNYVLRKENQNNDSWIKKMFDFKGSDSYSYSLDPQDKYGAQALSELRDRMLNNVANAVAQSAEHIDNFFKLLQIELAFYIGCINLHESLKHLKEPIAFPEPKNIDDIQQSFRGLYDISLALTMQQKLVSNDITIGEKSLIMITGANQGGKSTFLRSIGIAQLMMQCGMYVPAETFSANVYNKVFTHYKREEDKTLISGKFDEELERMSNIIDTITPNSLILFNESFASTNELEGSNIAKEIVNALLEKNIKIFYVTHLYSLTSQFYASNNAEALFLRAVRRPDGTRSYKLIEGKPLETSFGKDLYVSLFKESENEITNNSKI